MFNNFLEKIKVKKTELGEVIFHNKTSLAVAFVCALTSIISFNLGVYVGKSPSQEVIFRGLPTMANINESANLSPAMPTMIETAPSITASTSQTQDSPTQIIGNKNSHKYFFKTCGTTNSIKEVNRVYFSSEQEAQNAGFVLAGNCQRPK